jgi:hypothetical protein
MVMGSQAKKAMMVVALVAALLRAAQSQNGGSANADYQQSYDKWKTERLDDLKENWLPLAGLFWLKQGETALALTRKMTSSSLKDRCMRALSLCEVRT